MTDKPKFPLAIARRQAERLAGMLRPVCQRIEIAGSIRRQKELVGDVEIIYIPKFGTLEDKSDLFTRQVQTNLVDAVLDEMILRGWLVKRPKIDGTLTWGAEIKLARATATGIPIDFFATVTPHWHNHLVCRTGSAEHNIKIAAAAQARGWKWNPFGSGFSRQRGDGTSEIERMNSEQEVFAFVGLPYLEPWQRT